VDRPSGRARRAGSRPPKIHTGRAVDAGQDALDKRANVIRRVGPSGQHGEVEVLGEAVGLDIAFFQTCPAFEDPRLTQGRVGGDPPQQPAQNVILLDDLLGQTPLADPLNDVSARNHEASAGPRSMFTRRPQRRTIRPREVFAGSRVVRPALRRSRHAEISEASSTPAGASRLSRR